MVLQFDISQYDDYSVLFEINCQARVFPPSTLITDNNEQEYQK